MNANQLVGLLMLIADLRLQVNAQAVEIEALRAQLSEQPAPATPSDKGAELS